MSSMGITTARALIQAERQRQLEVEGYNAAHDDGHDDHVLLRAGMLYYANATRPGDLTLRMDGAPLGWPWEAKHWKPKSPLHDLVRAGALVLAEKERLRGARKINVHCDQKLSLIIRALAELPEAA